MAKSPALGICDCPDCGFSDAEIKQAKSGLAYRWCPDCNLQTFSRNETQSARMMKSIKNAVTVTEQKAVTPSVTVTEQKAPTVTAKNNDLDLGKL